MQLHEEIKTSENTRETRQIDYNDFINELLPTFIFNAILCLNIMFLWLIY